MAEQYDDDPHLDAEGLVKRSPGSIITFTGREVDPLTMGPEDVQIEDIAHSLALQCRYMGHSAGFYSVARHSIIVAHNAPDHLALDALLHDAAEAYLGDLPRPLKHGEFGEAYLAAEAKIEALIDARFGTNIGHPDVKEADRAVLTEIELGAEGKRHNYDGDWRADQTDFLELFDMLYEEPETVVVGITGYARSGKDTMGNILVEHFGFERLKFADPLYGMLLATNPFVRVDPGAPGGGWWALQSVVSAHGWEWLKEHSPDVRGLLQRLGTEGGRAHLGENVWVDAAMTKVRPGGRYVFTDVRFPNEAQAIHDAGGTVWRMTREGQSSDDPHPSEALVDSLPVDHVIGVGEVADPFERARRLHAIAGDLLG
jgi:hypothetical protein